jgi:hypothetical protein
VPVHAMATSGGRRSPRAGAPPGRSGTGRPAQTEQGLQRLLAAAEQGDDGEMLPLSGLAHERLCERCSTLLWLKAGVLYSSLQVQCVQRHANAHTEQEAEQQSQEKKPHMTPPLAVGAGEQNSFESRSISFHIQSFDNPVNLSLSAACTHRFRLELFIRQAGVMIVHSGRRQRYKRPGVPGSRNARSERHRPFTLRH